MLRCDGRNGRIIPDPSLATLCGQSSPVAAAALTGINPHVPCDGLVDDRDWPGQDVWEEF